MKILIVDNNLHIKGYPQWLMVLFYLGLNHVFDVRVKYPNQLSKEDIKVDKVILTGSMAYVRQEEDWMKHERKYISLWISRKTPILGICFGAQLLARHIFGKEAVKALPVPISGSIQFKFKEGITLFRGLPTPFGVVTTHYESFIIPSKYRIGEVEWWKNYAFYYPPCVYGLQFHPELMGTIGRNLVRLQKFLYDRHVYQDFTIASKGEYGRKIYNNFLSLT